jgi:catechol 2,3-dioxygenase
VSDYIRRMAHVAMRVPDLDASVDWATTVMGMRETERVDGVSYLTHKDCHHSLQYIASDESQLDHFAMEAHDDGALDALVQRLGDEGIAIESDTPQESGLTRAIRFRGPQGHLIEVFTGMSSDGVIHTGRGIQPREFGHPMLTCGGDTAPTRALFEDVLGFRLSDDVGDGTLVFMRCNPQHHGIGIAKGPAIGLNHYAFGVQDVGVLAQLGEVLFKNGSRFIWGPGRHGAGENLFTYHFDPAGCIVEYYADIYHVLDERTYEPGYWKLEEGKFENKWGPGAPPAMMETAIPQA